MDQLAQVIGLNIKGMRKQRGVSQEALAGLSGIDRSYMSRIERGVVSITVEVLYKISSALKCSPSQLLPDPSDLAC